MGINLGTPALEAITELRGNRHFEVLVTAIGQQTQLRMLGALNSPPELRADATGYARGVYELWAALHSAHAGLHQSQVKPPPLSDPEPPPRPARATKGEERVNG
jgi:hypothetical protein